MRNRYQTDGCEETLLDADELRNEDDPYVGEDDEDEDDEDEDDDSFPDDDDLDTDDDFDDDVRT